MSRSTREVCPRDSVHPSHTISRRDLKVGEEGWWECVRVVHWSHYPSSLSRPQPCRRTQAAPQPHPKPCLLGSRFLGRIPHRADRTGASARSAGSLQLQAPAGAHTEAGLRGPYARPVPPPGGERQFPSVQRLVGSIFQEFPTLARLCPTSVLTSSFLPLSFCSLAQVGAACRGRLADSTSTELLRGGRAGARCTRNKDKNWVLALKAERSKKCTVFTTRGLRIFHNTWLVSGLLHFSSFYTFFLTKWDQNIYNCFLIFSLSIFVYVYIIKIY